jgi:hypothetical protein
VRATLGDPRGNIGLAGHGRPIGAWSRRIGAPKASATGRDRNPQCSQGCSRDGPWHPRDERVQDGTTLRHPPSSKGMVEARRALARHRVGNLGSGVRLPRALWTLAPLGGSHRGRASPSGRGGATAPRCARVILAGRATSVPFTAVLNGPERTTTDNHEGASTCAVPRPRR